MTANSWLDEEPRASASLRQAGRLVLAGLRSKKALVIVVACCAASIAGAFLWTKHSYTPEFVLRVVEADNDPSGVPRPRRQLAEYVRKAVLTSERLSEVMSHHGLYASLARRNSRAALESFREDINVEVRQNYFVEERAVGGAPRSARLIISYRSADPAVAVSVTHELGELVVKREQATRKSEATRAAELASKDVDLARQALAQRRSAVASMRDEIDRQDTGAPERAIELIGLLGSLPALEARLDEQERRASSLALGAALEQRGMGTVFEVVNDALLAPDAGSQTGRALLASAAFVFALPLLAMAVGAFASGKACG